MNEFLLMLPFLLAGALYEGMETGVYSINRIRLRFRAGVRGSTGLLGGYNARVLHAILADNQMMVATTLTGTNISQYLATAYFTAALAGWGLAHAALWGTLMLAPVMLVFCEIVPKGIFARHANVLMYPLAPVFRGTTFALYPVIILLKTVMGGVNALFGRTDAQEMGRISRPRLMHFLEEGRREGVLSAHQDKMARNIMELERRPIRDVMVPLDQVVMLPVGATAEQVREKSVPRAYSRIPIYDGAKDNIIGILVLLEYLCDGGERPVDKLIRPARMLKHDMPVNEALLHLRRTRDHMGIVVGAEGRPTGIVTIKDLVEEIVGELKDW